MNEELKKEIQKLWEESRKDLTPAEKTRMTVMKNIAQEYDADALGMLVSLAWVCGNKKGVANLLNAHNLQKFNQ